MELIRDCEVSRLTPYDRNPRKNDDAVDAVVRSIEAFGFLNPIIVDAEFRICAGHTRHRAAIDMGLSTVPVIVAPELIGDKFTGFNIADNQTATIAEWDDAELRAILGELDKDDFDMSTLGFDGDELNEYLADDDAGGQTDPDDVSEPPVDPITKVGDLWMLGDHRLLCGDATKLEDVALLLNGAVPALTVTDPPYGVDYDPAWRDEAAKAGHISYATRRVGKVKNDDKADWRDAWSLLPGGVLYCWHADRHASEVQAGIESAGFEIRNQVIWAKSRFAISRGHYHWRHEPCWYAVKKGSRSDWVGDHSQTTLWEINLDANVAGGHGTQKPVECMARPIRNHKGDVYDPFVGSGTTLIAAEQLGRKCYAMEIDPTYCDVAVKRWEEFAGKKATRVKGKAVA